MNIWHRMFNLTQMLRSRFLQKCFDVPYFGSYLNIRSSNSLD